MSSIPAREVIGLSPEELGGNLREKIYKKLKSKFAGRCDKEYGYIDSINQDFTIVSNKISSTSGDILFTIDFKIETLRPEIGKEFEGTICMVFVHGFFVQIAENMKVLITGKSLDGFTYNKIENIFEKEIASKKKKDKKTKIVYKQGDKINVVIEQIQFENKNFHCSGVIKE